MKNAMVNAKVNELMEKLESIKKAAERLVIKSTTSILEIRQAIAAGITAKHSGKMQGLASYSTSTLLNPFCRNMRQKTSEKCICTHCYAESLLKMRDSLSIKLAYNTGIISTKILPPECFPILNYKFFRLESFGDLNNYVQAANYIIWISQNPNTFFGWWTKRPELIAHAMHELGIDKLPNNCNVIYSDPLIDDQKPEWIDDYIMCKYPFIATKFSVYTDPAEKQNCPKSCINCLYCYRKITAQNRHLIIEKLK